MGFHSDIDYGSYAPDLQAAKACYITLERDGDIRGCAGSLYPTTPLIECVAQNAWSAAFEDPGSSSIGADEMADLGIEIAILSEPEVIPCTSKKQLLEQIRPGTDGLIIESYSPGNEIEIMSTLLPSAWNELQQPEQFVDHLLNSAGLESNEWRDSLMIKRYTTMTIQ